MKKKVVVLGSSGSIGCNTLRVLKQLKDKFEVKALAVKNSVEVLAEQAVEVDCRNLVVGDEKSLDKLRTLVPEYISCRCGSEALVDTVVQEDVDTVVCAIVGTAGLQPVLAALRAGKRVALASKEVMVMAGDLVNAELAAGHGSLIPVDSEHSALFQCLEHRKKEDVNKLILTASGGPFRDWSAEALQGVTLQDALKHPVWAMGRKITIDSATLMNKALEVIEAGYLFNVDASCIDVVIHPQSLVHSMVEFCDRSVIAQISNPDMRTAIQYALTWPDRFDGGWAPWDWSKNGRMEFLPPDRKKFPGLELGFAALRAGGTMPAVLNAANEVAVDAFIANAIRFDQIWQCVASVMEQHTVEKADSLPVIIAADAAAREMAAVYCKKNQK